MPRTPKTTAKAKATPKTLAEEPVRALRKLGDDEGRDAPAAKAPKPKSSAALRTYAREMLAGEFEKALALIEKRKAESAIGGKEKGRDPARAAEAHRSVIASLEGMNRFALGLGLLTPAESRELYAAAIKQGLYEGWK